MGCLTAVPEKGRALPRGRSGGPAGSAGLTGRGRNPISASHAWHGHRAFRPGRATLFLDTCIGFGSAFCVFVGCAVGLGCVVWSGGGFCSGGGFLPGWWRSAGGVGCAGGAAAGVIRWWGVWSAVPGWAGCLGILAVHSEEWERRLRVCPAVLPPLMGWGCRGPMNLRV